jgi:hypothetical protein
LMLCSPAGRHSSAHRLGQRRFVARFLGMVDNMEVGSMVFDSQQCSLAFKQVLLIRSCAVLSSDGRRQIRQITRGCETMTFKAGCSVAYKRNGSRAEQIRREFTTQVKAAERQLSVHSNLTMAVFLPARLQERVWYIDKGHGRLGPGRISTTISISEICHDA